MAHTTEILCVIANDAEVCGNKYIAVGKNYRVRMKTALRWLQQNLSPDKNVIFAFGAGTDRLHSSGPALASLCEECLLDQTSDVSVLTNRTHREFYGTLEEIEWIVRKVSEEHTSHHVRFVFFTQKRHIFRVWFIWLLFHRKRWGPAKFVVTPQVNGKTSFFHEVVTSGKIVAIRFGLIKPRYEK